MLDESRFSVGGLGVDSLLEVLPAGAALAFVLDFPKKSFAVEDISFLTGGSGFGSTLGFPG